jgi:hypothetical protein
MVSRLVWLHLAPVPTDQGELHDPHVVQKRLVPFGPSDRCQSKLAAVLIPLLPAALHNSLTVMPSVDAFL